MSFCGTWSPILKACIEAMPFAQAPGWTVEHSQRLFYTLHYALCQLLPFPAPPKRPVTFARARATLDAADASSEHVVQARQRLASALAISPYPHHIVRDLLYGFAAGFERQWSTEAFLHALVCGVEGRRIQSHPLLPPGTAIADVYAFDVLNATCVAAPIDAEAILKHANAHAFAWMQQCVSTWREGKPMARGNVRLGIDLDGVVCDFDGELAAAMRAAGVNDEKRIAESVTQRKEYRIKDALAGQLMRAPGFYAQMKPLPGALEKVRALLSAGCYYDVWFCTTPMRGAEDTSAGEKIAWIKAHFGDEAARRVITTHDKTLVELDYLIDDRPDIGALGNPAWQHILFSQSYNREVNAPLRLEAWSAWEDVY